MFDYEIKCSERDIHERGTRADLGLNRGMGIDLGVNDRSEVEDPSAEIYTRFFACQASPKEGVSF